MPGPFLGAWNTTERSEPLPRSRLPFQWHSLSLQCEAWLMAQQRPRLGGVRTEVCSAVVHFGALHPQSGRHRSLSTRDSDGHSRAVTPVRWVSVTYLTRVRVPNASDVPGRASPLAARDSPGGRLCPAAQPAPGFPCPPASVTHVLVE